MKYEIYYKQLDSGLYGVFYKDKDVGEKLIFTCNRAFNAEIVAHTLAADEKGECVRLSEI